MGLMVLGEMSFYQSNQGYNCGIYIMVWIICIYVACMNSSLIIDAIHSKACKNNYCYPTKECLAWHSKAICIVAFVWGVQPMVAHRFAIQQSRADQWVTQPGKPKCVNGFTSSHLLCCREILGRAVLWSPCPKDGWSQPDNFGCKMQ